MYKNNLHELFFGGGERNTESQGGGVGLLYIVIFIGVLISAVSWYFAIYLPGKSRKYMPNKTQSSSPASPPINPPVSDLNI